MSTVIHKAIMWDLGPSLGKATKTICGKHRNFNFSKQWKDVTV